MYNGYRYCLQWLDDLSFESTAAMVLHRDEARGHRPGRRVVGVKDVNGQRGFPALFF